MMTAQPLDQWPKWRDSLIYHLRMKDIPGDRIGDILLEVDTHVRESGEAPESAFGDAKSYAATRADSFPAPSRTEKAERNRGLILIGLTAFAGSALYATGAQAIGAGTDALFGINAWIAFVIGAAIVFVGLWRLPIDLIRHPTTNESMSGNAHTTRLIWVMILVAIGVVFYFVGRTTGG